MRLLPLAILLVASPALADKALDDLVRASVEKLPALPSDADLGIAKDAVIIEPRGYTVDRSKSRTDCGTGGHVAQIFYCYGPGAAAHKAGKLLTATRGDIAWFHVPFVVTQKGDDGRRYKKAHRASGVAVKDGGAWTIKALAYTDVVPDTQLATRPRQLATGDAPVLGGDAALAKAFAAWFPASVAAHADKAAIAAGTAPNETGAGAAATKLAAKWDALKLVLTEVDATLVAGGTVGLVKAGVLLRRKNGKSAYRFGLVAIVVPDGADWRWVSLHYYSPEPDAIEDVMTDERLEAIGAPK